MESVKLSGNGSSSLSFNSSLVQFSSLDKSILSTRSDGDFQNAESPIHFRTLIHAYHPLEIRKANQTHVITVVYKNSDNRTSGFSQPLVTKINFGWRIETWDLGNFNYFWIIFSGVLLSRIFPLFSNQKEAPSGDDDNHSSSNSAVSKVPERLKLRPIEFVWVPFSAIITLLIFSSFKGQIQPTTDIIGNMALAFGFGFGFDKVLNMGHRF